MAVRAAVRRPPVSFWWSIYICQGSAVEPQTSASFPLCRAQTYWSMGCPWQQSLLAAAAPGCALLRGHFSMARLAIGIPGPTGRCWCAATGMLLAGLQQLLEDRCAQCI